jgi:uncharacterized heparinase superfamily protein
MKLFLLLRTIRHLKPIQIAARIWLHLHRPRISTDLAPPLRAHPGRWGAPIPKAACMLSATQFRFLNETHECCAAADWNHPDYPKLWLYNLHYFDFINANGVTEGDGNALINRWISENPPPLGNGWEPYTLSPRIVNWIKWHLAGHALSPAQIDSLAQQIRFLRGRLEYHLLGNHLLANAKALIFGGMFFAGLEADAWLQRGIALYDVQHKEQMLPDGGHFERSPMYHAIILEDLLDVLNLFGTTEAALAKTLHAALRGAAVRMLRWLATLSHPDGEIAFFNDAALGIAPNVEQLKAYAERLGIGFLDDEKIKLAHLEDSGFFRIQRGTMTLLADVGSVGPLYQPGHAHAGTLSFELSVGQQRLFVNSGTSCYGTSEERIRQRKTSAHNTLCVDGLDSSEVWGGHRVARRAHVLEAKMDAKQKSVVFSACHDGFSRFRTFDNHCRTWTVKDQQLMIEDILEGNGIHEIIIAFFLHPVLQASFIDDRLLRISDRPGKEIARLSAPEFMYLELHDSTYHPQFGTSTPNQRVTIRCIDALPTMITTKIEIL